MSEGITRRHVLAATGAVALAGSTTALALRHRWWNHPHAPQLKALSQDEYDVVQAIGEAWMPPGEGPPDPSGAEADVGAFVDEIVSRMPPEQARLFKLLLHILDDTTMVIEFQPYRKLDHVRRTNHLNVWIHSPWPYLRQATSAVLILVAMGYTRHPDVAKHLQPYFRCGYGA